MVVDKAPYSGTMSRFMAVLVGQTSQLHLASATAIIKRIAARNICCPNSRSPYGLANSVCSLNYCLTVCSFLMGTRFVVAKAEQWGNDCFSIAL